MVDGTWEPTLRSVAELVFFALVVVASIAVLRERDEDDTARVDGPPRAE